MSIFTGILWAGTAEEDAAYRTTIAAPNHMAYDRGTTAQGFNLTQWFTDQGIAGDHSYYQYAKIRGLTDDQFKAGVGGEAYLNAGFAYGNNDLSNLYSYGGTNPADQVKVAPQNIVPISDLGIDTWGRPLPAGYQTPGEMAAKRLAGSTGGQSSSIGGGGAAAGPESQTSPLALGKLEPLGKK